MSSGLSPRIRYGLKIVSCQSNRRVLVIRVERSWNGPHRVIFKGHDKFYGRNSAGKYPLDVDELRAAFTSSSTASERIRAFRVDRIIALSNNETPVPFVPGSKIVLHYIPVQSFATQISYDVLPFYQHVTKFRPIGTWSCGTRLNLDGVVSFAAGQPSRSYTQLYRTGVIEVVDGATLNSSAGQQGRRAIPSIYYEKLLLDYFPLCVEIFQSLGVGAPIVVALTLTDVKGFVMGVHNSYVGGGHGIDRDSLLLPETIVTDFSISPSKILKPLFDLIWNACGFPTSRNFDANGDWNARE